MAGDAVVTVLEFHRSTRALTVRFSNAGYWLHVGGIYGRSARDERMIRLATKRQRLEQELRRIGPQRFND